MRGVVYRSDDGRHELRALLTVGADGRFSKVRHLAGLRAVPSGEPPMDVLWFRLPRQPGDPEDSATGALGQGRGLAMLSRPTDWQIAFIFPKGGYQRLRAAGLEALRRSIVELVPWLAGRVDRLQDWHQLALLSTEASCCRRWYRPGLLLIGDAAHVMSPAGGVGINNAIQDAVATANLLTGPLLQGAVRVRELAAVQRRTRAVTHLVQALQAFGPRRLITPRGLLSWRTGPAAVGSSPGAARALPVPAARLADDEVPQPGERTRQRPTNTVLRRAPMSSAALLERFHGCLLGLAVGDALGGRFEGQSPDWIAGRYPTLEVLLANAPADTIHYTDDTQMAIGVAETLIENLDILEDRLRHHFVANYVPSRGYGRGARCVLEAMQEGQDYKEVAATHFPGGSLGNGAAMRVAPVGLFFHDDLDQVWEQARLSALPTHIHPLGIEGAQLLAVAVALCLGQAPFDRTAFFGELLRRCQSDDYRERLGWAATAQAPDDLARIGNGIKALESVPTAIALFASAPESYSEVIGRADPPRRRHRHHRGDGGRPLGAYLGADAIPAGLLSRLEDDVKGRTYLAYLAEQLHQSHETRAGV